MASLSQQFQVGQKVHLQHLEHGCQITIVEDGQAGQEVVEIGRDYLVIDDAAAGVTTRIPRHVICTGSPPTPAPVPAPALAQSA